MTTPNPATKDRQRGMLRKARVPLHVWEEENSITTHGVPGVKDILPLLGPDTGVHRVRTVWVQGRTPLGVFNACAASAKAVTLYVPAQTLFVQLRELFNALRLFQSGEYMNPESEAYRIARHNGAGKMLVIPDAGTTKEYPDGDASLLLDLNQHLRTHMLYGGGLVLGSLGMDSLHNLEPLTTEMANQFSRTLTAHETPAKGYGTATTSPKPRRRTA